MRPVPARSEGRAGSARTRALGPVRAAVVLPWERGGRADVGRVAEARLAEAVGLAAGIGLVVV
ncbi:MAG: hypothetical protein ACREF0_09645, partial [Acetobacteraceae bacterium]